ncbi:LysR family transcriptional regulator [Phyllobacterium trifolii]|uniref:LysR family transcriptional regulator n=1 Tax=Phyllobacterium trifolii TaxID=300193 RepID=UPI0016117FD7|nr:LysR family transcriptional regulator [Phyllobacterium trifolii]
MELHQLRCFVAVAEELHFGRAAQKLNMLPASLGRHIRLLEDGLGTRLMVRTTRNVAMTDDGLILLDEAKQILEHVDAVINRFNSKRRDQNLTLRVGAIDSAAAGLLPLLLHDFRKDNPDVEVQLLEDKSLRLVPKLLSGRIDLAFIRHAERPDRKLNTMFLFHETAVVAMSTNHPLADNEDVSIDDLAGEPLIVPERRSRPHSHDLTIKLFTEAGLQARIVQLAGEKQTIVNLVAAEIGLAIVPRWTSRLAVTGVRYIPLRVSNEQVMNKLPLSVAWVKGVRDPVRDAMIAILQRHLKRYADHA